MIENYAGCEKCPLKDRPPIRGKGPRDGLCIVGEAPGRTEVREKSPFVGASGRIIRGVLTNLGVNPEQVYYTNAVLCHPEGNATPSSTAIECCRRRLLGEIEFIHPTKLLLLGGTAMKSVLGATSVMKSRGLGQFVPISDWSVFTVGSYHPAAVLRDDQLFRDLVFDVSKLLDNEGPLDPPEVTTVIVETVDQALEELAYLSEATLLSCDLETSGLSPIRDHIYSIGFGTLLAEDVNVGYSVIIPIAVAELVIDEIAKFIRTFSGGIAFHNAKFDLQFLWAWVGDPHLQPKHLIDTMLMQYALDERGGEEETSSNSRGYATRGLKDLARLRYDKPDYGFSWKSFYDLPEDERPYHDLYEYQGLDCYYTARLYGDLRQDLDNESEKLWDLVDTLLVPVSVALARVEFHGAPLDRYYLEGLKVQTLEVLEGYLGKIRGVAAANGFPETFNPNSVPQMLKLFQAVGFKVTSTEKETLLLELKAKPPYSEEILSFVRTVLDYRQRSKVLKTYIEGMLNRMDIDDCVRPDFMVHGTPTGRLACRDPNLQNIPTLMGPEIRNAFIARPGYSLINADYSQLELRVAAWYSRDENLIKAFIEGKDVHRWVAALMFKKPEAEITHLERYLAKYLDFGLIYGRSARGITEGWEAEHVVEMGGDRWTLAEAEGLTRAFFRAFPKLEVFIERQHKIVRAQSYVETPTGRRRRFPMQTNQIIGSTERKSVNTPIQSLASDMTLTSIVRFDRQLPIGASIISTVHDSIMFEVRDDLVTQVANLIHSIMEVPCIREFDIPLRVDVEVGSGLNARWGLLGE